MHSGQAQRLESGGCQVVKGQVNTQLASNIMLLSTSIKPVLDHFPESDAKPALQHYSTLITSDYLSVCLSVCMSVTLVDCDHIVQQKWKWAHDRIVRCLGYMHAKTDLDCNQCLSGPRKKTLWTQYPILHPQFRPTQDPIRCRTVLIYCVQSPPNAAQFTNFD